MDVYAHAKNIPRPAARRSDVRLHGCALRHHEHYHNDKFAARAAAALSSSQERLQYLPPRSHSTNAPKSASAGGESASATSRHATRGPACLLESLSAPKGGSASANTLAAPPRSQSAPSRVWVSTSTMGSMSPALESERGAGKTASTPAALIRTAYTAPARFSSRRRERAAERLRIQPILGLGSHPGDSALAISGSTEAYEVISPVSDSMIRK